MNAKVSPAYDALIIGAGPAGSTLAIQLAQAGWSVALVERQAFPRRKVCGECIAASNMPLLVDLGIGAAVEAAGSPVLQRITLMRGDDAVTAPLPMAQDGRFPWGLALGRETLDTLLIERARNLGVAVWQPWSVQSIGGTAGDWQCEVREVNSHALAQIKAIVVVDAHGSWEPLPQERSKRRKTRSAKDLFAFKANFTGGALARGTITVLALNGGYGGMVVADGGLTTVACCIRRDRLTALRLNRSGLKPGEVVESWLQSECAGVEQALRGAVRDGPWLTSGPLSPGIRLSANDQIFKVGNAAGEAHPILGEGMSMAMQSGALLASYLLSAAAAVPGRAGQAELQQRYARDWRTQFRRRLQLAATFAHVAMRPASAATLLKLAHLWPDMLTQGAHWGGKVRPVKLAHTLSASVTGTSSASACPE